MTCFLSHLCDSMFCILHFVFLLYHPPYSFYNSYVHKSFRLFCATSGYLVRLLSNLFEKYELSMKNHGGGCFTYLPQHPSQSCLLHTRKNKEIENGVPISIMFVALVQSVSGFRDICILPSSHSFQLDLPLIA